MSAIGLVKSVVDRSVWLSHLNYLKGQMLYRLGITAHRSGATHSGLEIEESIGYIREVVDDYLSYAGVDTAFLEGKRVLEVGPGDNLGVGLLLLARGAASYVAVDRFRPQADGARNAAVYERLLHEMTPREQENVADVARRKPDGTVQLDGPRLAAHYESGLDQLAASGDKFDIIISRAVLEHVADLEQTWQQMVELLDPGDRRDLLRLGPRLNSAGGGDRLAGLGRSRDVRRTDARVRSGPVRQQPG